MNITLLGQVIPIPARNALLQTNGLSGTGSLTVQANACIAQHNQKPTFTLVDYYDVGGGSVFRTSPSKHQQR